MKKQKSNYWEERAAASQNKITDLNIGKVQNILKRYYSKTLDKTLDSFEKVYLRIFHNITEGQEITPADLYKLDRYWKLQGDLQRELQKLGDKEVELLTQSFIQQYEMVYKGLAIEGESFFSTLDSGAAKQMINQIWCADGKAWSQRVWDNLAKLQQELNDNLVQCIIAGRNTSFLKKSLMERFNVSYNRANTIVRTEMAHIQTQAAADRYKSYGISKYMFLADPDERTCDICGSLDRKEFYFAEMQVGVNAPPMHPNDRCCIVPVVED